MKISADYFSRQQTFYGDKKEYTLNHTRKRSRCTLSRARNCIGEQKYRHPGILLRLVLSSPEYWIFGVDQSV